MLVIFIAVYVIGFIICLIAEDYLLALVWPLFLICLLVDLYVWFCENMILFGRRLRNGSSKK